MKLELILPREQYLLGERINLDLRLTNPGKTAVEVPALTGRGSAQPVYRLRGPAYPDGVSFHFAADPAAADQTAANRLEAGETMEDGFSLTSLKPIAEPGDYTLGATMQGKGWSAEAPPIRFRVEKAKFLDASLGVDVFSPTTTTFRAVWTADTERGRVLGETFFYENRPDLSEVRLTSTRIIRAIGAKATDPFCPWINYDRASASKYWHGWREGSALFAFSDDEDSPRTFDMGSARAHIVRHTVMNRAGDLHVLVLSENRTTLRLIRFPHAEGSGASVQWTAELPEPGANVGLGLGPADEGGSMVALAVSQRGLKLALRLIRIGAEEAEIGAPTLLDEAFVLPSSEPGVHIAPDGTIRAAVVVAKHPALRTLAVAELLASPGGNISTSFTDAGKADTAVAKAIAAYTATEGPPSMAFLIHPTAADILRMSFTTYQLTIDPNRGVRLTAME